MNKIRSSLVIVVALSALAYAGSLSAQRPRAEGEAFPIVLHRPQVVGARSRIERQGEKHIRIERRAGESWQAIQSEDVVITLRAEEQVLAVNTIGLVTSADYVIERLEIRRGTARTTPLARGTVLHRERMNPSADALYMANGLPVEPEVASALSIIFGGKAREITDDQVFGSTTPRRVGDTWPIADAIAEQDLARSARVNVDLSGNVELVAAGNVSGVPCLTIAATMSGRLSAIPNMPPSARFESGTLEATQRAALPRDGTSQAVTGELALTVEAAFSVAATAQQPQQNFRMTVRESKRETSRAIR